jgi:hypothetical protein
VLKQDNQSLNQMYLAQDSHLTIQILDQPDNYFNSTGDLGILLYVHLRKSNGGGFEKVKEFMYFGNQMKKLPEVLSEAFNIPIKNLLIARFDMFKGYWEIIFRDTEKENKVPNENPTTASLTPTKTKLPSDKPPLGEITSNESNTIQPIQQQDTQSPPQTVHPNSDIPSQTVHPNSDNLPQAESAHPQPAEQPNTDKSQTQTQTQTNPPQGKRRRQGKRKRPFMVDGCMIAIKDLRTDPNEEDDFAIEAAAFRSYIHSIYEPRSRGYTEKHQSHNRAREAVLKITVSDEEYSYEEVSYSDEEGDLF